MCRMYRHVLPAVDAELGRLRLRAERIPDAELRRQALASMESKRFHCQGGAVYAAADPAWRPVLVPLIVALQTISDYLDNLCDRSTSADPADFRLLHRSMLDAVDPEAPRGDYYAERAEREDAGYLHHLVEVCQRHFRKLPSYPTVQPLVSELVGLYGDLQVYKHGPEARRRPQLIAWWERHRDRWPGLRWNEFAAAAGSTVGMFALFAAACREGVSAADAAVVRDAYFPYVCALHILLDNLIDRQEDEAAGDLNLCRSYGDEELLVERLRSLARRAREEVGRLPAAGFHRMVIEGMLGLYLSDPKVRDQNEVREISHRLLRQASPAGWFFSVNSRWIRRRQPREVGG